MSIDGLKQLLVEIEDLEQSRQLLEELYYGYLSLYDTKINNKESKDLCYRIATCLDIDDSE